MQAGTDRIKGMGVMHLEMRVRAMQSLEGEKDKVWVQIGLRLGAVKEKVPLDGLRAVE